MLLWDLPPSWENRFAYTVRKKTESENTFVYVGTGPLIVFQVWTKGILDWKIPIPISIYSCITHKYTTNSEMCYTVKIPITLRAHKRET